MRRSAGAGGGKKSRQMSDNIHIYLLIAAFIYKMIREHMMQQ